MYADFINKTFPVDGLCFFDMIFQVTNAKQRVKWLEERLEKLLTACHMKCSNLLESTEDEVSNTIKLLRMAGYNNSNTSLTKFEFLSR